MWLKNVRFGIQVAAVRAALSAPKGERVAAALDLEPTPAQDARVPSSPGEIKLSFAPVVKRVTPAVVNVYAARVGQDRVRQYLHTLPELKYGTLFNHMQLQPVIDIAPDGKTAKGRWRAFEQFGALHRSAQWAEGTYENEYVKEDGVWKISKLHYYMTYYVDYYKGWDQGGNPAPGPIAAMPASTAPVSGPDLAPTDAPRMRIV